MEGEPVAPVQSMTCIVYSVSALVGCGLFLEGEFGLAGLGCLAATQLRRFVSETLRSDFRGGGKISAYQVMSLLSLAYAAGLFALFPAGGGPSPDLAVGIASLWSPGVLLSLQGLWVLVFIYMGRSMVTTSSVSFSVVRENT